MVTARSVVRAGKGRPSRQNSLYEKTSSSIEVTKARIGVRGTNDYDIKLSATETIAECVFEENLSQPPYNSTSEIFDTSQSQDNKSCQVWELENFFVFKGLINTTVIATKNKLAAAETGSGKLIAKTASKIAAAIFLETLTSTSLDVALEALFLGPLGGLSPVIKTETLTTPSSYVFEATYTPIAILHATTAGGTATTHNVVVMDIPATELVATNISWEIDSKSITAASTDAVTQLTIIYLYLPGNE